MRYRRLKSVHVIIMHENVKFDFCHTIETRT